MYIKIFRFTLVDNRNLIFDAGDIKVKTTKTTQGKHFVNENYFTLNEENTKLK